MTKYGIEDMIGKTYPNNMPAYKGKLTDGRRSDCTLLHKKHLV